MSIQTEHIATPLDLDRTRIVSKLVDLQAEVSERNAQIEVLKAELRDLPAGDFTIDGRPALRITPTRRFDTVKGAGLLDPAQREAAVVMTFDAAKVKQHLTPFEVEECMVESGKPKVQVL